MRNSSTPTPNAVRGSSDAGVEIRLARAMAELMLTREAVEREALVALGFTRAEIDAHGEAAMTRARRDARVAARLEAAA